VIETRSLISAQVEQKIEELCLCFERMKPYLISRWDAEAQPEKPPSRDSGVVERASQEVER
jgi:hypothetical protein